MHRTLALSHSRDEDRSTFVEIIYLPSSLIGHDGHLYLRILVCSTSI